MKNAYFVILASVFFVNCCLGQCIDRKNSILNTGQIESGVISQSTNSEYWDAFFSNELKLIEKYFNIKVRLYFEHETNNLNTWASNDGKWGHSDYDDDGSIGFSMEFIRIYQNDLFTIGSTFAHEAAHILQFRNYWEDNDEKDHELFCDLMAGIYLNNRKDLGSIISNLNIKEGDLKRWVTFDSYGNIPFYEIKDALRSMETLGDDKFWHVDHHGTAGERFYAVAAGYLLCANFYNMRRLPYFYPRTQEFYEIGKNLIESKCIEFDGLTPEFNDYGTVNIKDFEKLFWPDYEFKDCSKAIFGQTESVYFTGVFIEKGAVENGLEGIRIHVSYHTSNLKNTKCLLTATLVQNGGAPVDRYGNIAEAKVHFTPKYDNSLFSDTKLFIPFSSMPLDYISEAEYCHIVIDAFKGNMPLSYQSMPASFMIK